MENEKISRIQHCVAKWIFLMNLWKNLNGFPIFFQISLLNDIYTNTSYNIVSNESAVCKYNRILKKSFERLGIL